MGILKMDWHIYEGPGRGRGQNSVKSVRYAPPPPPPPIFRQKESGTKIICSYLKQEGP